MTGGIGACGVLDFQDALCGPITYDLVSLLQDARRDVPPAVVADTISRYVTAAGLDKDAFEAAFAVLGAQRNLRILGVFARLAREQGKRRYLEMMPRVWGHLAENLRHPALEPVAGFLLETIPEPTRDHQKSPGKT